MVLLSCHCFPVPAAEVCNSVSFLCSFRSAPLVFLFEIYFCHEPRYVAFLTNTCARQQIDDTVGVMRENINKVSQRGEHLDSLQDKTDNLAVSAQGFRRGANRVRKQMWWKDMKMRVCLIVAIIILIIVIVVPGTSDCFALDGLQSVSILTDSMDAVVTIHH